MKHIRPHARKPIRRTIDSLEVHEAIPFQKSMAEVNTVVQNIYRDDPVKRFKCVTVDELILVIRLRDYGAR